MAYQKQQLIQALVLVEEAQTDDIFTLDNFMEAYS